MMLVIKATICVMSAPLLITVALLQNCGHGKKAKDAKKSCLAVYHQMKLVEKYGLPIMTRSLNN
jgi:hypothetical protein